MDDRNVISKADPHTEEPGDDLLDEFGLSEEGLHVVDLTPATIQVQSKDRCQDLWRYRPNTVDNKDILYVQLLAPSILQYLLCPP